MALSLSMVLKHSAVVILTRQEEPAAKKKKKKTQLSLLLPTLMLPNTAL